MRRAIAVVVLCSGLTSACEFGDGDAKVPGQALGSYEVTGRLKEDTCKAPALGVTDPWQFEVKLSRFERDLYWLNGREAIVGEIGDDDVSFRFETRVDIELVAPKGRAPGCTIERADVANGKLSSSDEDVETFNGEMHFTYSQKDKSDCSAYDGEGFAALPCAIGYAVGAVRIANME